MSYTFEFNASHRPLREKSPSRVAQQPQAPIPVAEDTIRQVNQPAPKNSSIRLPIALAVAGIAGGLYYAPTATISALLLAAGGYFALCKLGGKEAVQRPADEPDFYNAIKEGDEKIVRTFIRQGENVNVPMFGHNKTPLEVACLYGKAQIVELLIESGASVNTNSLLNTFQSDVSDVEGDFEEIALLLINKGVDINSAREESYPPLFFALEDGAMSIKVAQHLISKGAKIEPNMLLAACKRNEHEKDSLEMVKYLISKGAKIDARDPYLGTTPIHFAALHNNLQMVKLLLEKGADPHAKDIDGKTPAEWGKHNPQIVDFFAKMQS